MSSAPSVWTGLSQQYQDAPCVLHVLQVVRVLHLEVLCAMLAKAAGFDWRTGYMSARTACPELWQKHRHILDRINIPETF